MSVPQPVLAEIAFGAHALAADATLVTADVGHMTRVPGLQIEDWTVLP